MATVQYPTNVTGQTGMHAPFLHNSQHFTQQSLKYAISENGDENISGLHQAE
jgi:hypothetical protein